MSKLSELLNPVPGANSPGSPINSINHDAPDKLHQDQTSKTLTLAPIHSGSPAQKPTLESPLDALANAATSSPPLVSPTHPLEPPLISFGAPLQGHTSSRPNSSGISPPPLELSHQTEHSIGKFSPDLEQYHHSSSHEVRARRLSDITDGTSRTLPPLRSLPEERSPTAMPLPTGQYQDVMNNRHNHAEVTERSPKALPMKPERELENAGNPDAMLQEPLESSRPFSSTKSSRSQADEVEVKAETMDTLEVLQGSLGHNENGAAGEVNNKASRRSSVSTEPTLPIKAADSMQDPDFQPFSARIKASKPAPSKKRAAPKPKIEKKGTASTIKPAAKRRKIEKENANDTPFRSGTPASSRASKTPAPGVRKQESVTPARSSSIVMHNEDEDDEDEDEDEDDDEEDNELFCICRKPDDHTWMIACDGLCQDWFHGRCVGMDEKDGNLIDKYICPNCKANGDSQTTWKPMCRLETCRNPARVAGNKPSKYCSDDHGVEFMRNHALKGEPEEIKAVGLRGGNKKRKRDNAGSGNMEGDTEMDDTPSYLRGGVLCATELKALVGSVNDIAEFRKLGEGVLSPPRTASPDDDSKTEDSKPKSKVTYSAEESNQLNEITTKIETLRTQKSLLSDRDRFLGLVKARAKTVLEELRKRDTELKRKDTIKDICGYDARLSWSDEEFHRWRSLPEGQTALDHGPLGPPTTTLPVAPPPPTSPSSEPFAPMPTSPTPAPDNATAPADADAEDEIGKGVCQRRHCARHRTWWKLHQQELAFEKEEVRLGVRRLEEEEMGVRGRGMVRWLEGGGD